MAKVVAPKATNSTSKSKSYHANLDELLRVSESPLVRSAYSNQSAPNPTTTGITTDQHKSSSESLLLDTFYENLLRKNALALTQLEDQEEISPKLHFDVTKLAAINSINHNPNRCSTVTKKRIDSKNLLPHESTLPNSLITTKSPQPATKCAQVKTKKLKNSNQIKVSMNSNNYHSNPKMLKFSNTDQTYQHYR